MPDDVTQGLKKEQKVGFTFLLIFGILAVGLGFLQMRNNIYSPFVVRPVAETRPQIVVDETVRLQRIDTDKDGINDFEELQFYKTSPYLADTDSDGIGDKVEIQNGTDPSCPEGQDCGQTSGTAVIATTSANVITPIAENVASPEEIIGQVGGQVIGPGGQLDIEALIKDPQRIRTMLLQTNQITETDLNKISDEALIKLVQEMRATGGAPGTVTLPSEITGEAPTSDSSNDEVNPAQ